MDADSTKTLVHAFISSRVDYCNAVFNGAPQYVMSTLQRVLNAAARLVTDTRKYDRSLTLLHGQLHMLNVPEREETLEYRRCLQKKHHKMSGQLLHSGRRHCQSTSTISQPVPLDRYAVST